MEERRHNLIAAAMDLFLDRGYEAVSINDIINVAGGSKATVYALFGDKPGLFDEVLRTNISAVSLSIDTRTTGTIEQQLAALGRAFLDNLLQPRIVEFHRMMISLGRTSPPLAQLFYEAGPRTAYKVFAEWMAQRQAAGLMGGEPESLAVLFHDMLMTELQLSLLTGAAPGIDEAALDRKVKASVSLLLHGCGRAATPAAGDGGGSRRDRKPAGGKRAEHAGSRPATG